MKITFLGHATFALEHDGTTVLIDPWLTGNPSAPVGADELDADAIVLTHGHPDHYGDVVGIARRTGAPVITILELAEEVAGQLDEGHPTVPFNVGGTVSFDWGWVKMVPAFHSSRTQAGLVTPPTGMVVNLGGVTVYHLGDTALFGDLRYVGRSTPVDVALMCIGGHFTMDRHDAVIAAELIGAKQVIPCHYDTFPPIATDAAAFKADVERETSSEVVILAPGESHTA